jgi:hypothetical protein
MMKESIETWEVDDVLLHAQQADLEQATMMWILTAILVLTKTR